MTRRLAIQVRCLVLSAMLAIAAQSARAGGESVPRQVSIPTLTSEQIRALVTENTIRVRDKNAVFFGIDGKAEGWFDEWLAADLASCPQPEIVGDAYRFSEGQCRIRNIVLLRGTWQVSDYRLCYDLSWDVRSSRIYKEGRITPCTYLARIDDVVLYISDSGTVSDRRELRRGRVLDQGPE